MKIRIGSFNILNTSCRYEERKSLIKSTIDSLNCDVIGLQEINLSVNSLQFDLEKYSLHFSPLPETMRKAEPNFIIQGNAVLVKKDIEVIDHYHLTYSNKLRVAQMLVLKKEDKEFVLVNTHLDHLSDVTRETQLREMLDFVRKMRGSPIVCTGDYNFLPESRPYEIMTREFSSSQAVCNKKEPLLTFPTGLTGAYADPDEYGCLDYIWFQGPISPQASTVFRNCGSNEIWASDHYPLYTDFTLS